MLSNSMGMYDKRLWQTLRASSSVCIKLYKMKKVTDFTYFEQKNTHISGCKIVYKCTIATVIVHICTVTVAIVHLIF